MSLSLSKTSAPANATIQVLGDGFPSSDSSCTLSGEVVASATCSLSSGTISGTFIVANVPAGPYIITATSNPSGDSTDANLTVTASTMNETTSSITPGLAGTGTPGGAGFTIASNPSITLASGASGSATIEISSVDGFSAPVTLSASWVGTPPGGVNYTLASPMVPSAGGSANASLTVTASPDATPGRFELQVTGTSGKLVQTSDLAVQVLQAPMTSTSVSMTNTTVASPSSTTTSTVTSVPKCAVSSATSGSELAPLVQQLRSFRDQSILNTRVGAAFMEFFNSWYYSYSPAMASYVSSHPTERAMLRVGLYPLVGILYASYHSYLILSPINSELAALAAGLLAAALLGFMYIAIPAQLAAWILRRKLGVSKLKLSRLSVCPAISALLVGVTYLFGGNLALGIATAGLILSTLALGAAVGIRTLGRSHSPYPIQQLAILSKFTPLARRRLVDG